MPDATHLTGIEFGPSVRSDTYSVDYGRILGTEWMARSTGWSADTEEETMDNSEQRDVAEEEFNLSLMNEQDEEEFALEVHGSVEEYAEEILSDLPEWMLA